jgi:hypothetical protein
MPLNTRGTKWPAEGLRFQNSFKQVKGNISGLQQFVIELRAVCVYTQTAFSLCVHTDSI